MRCNSTPVLFPQKNCSVPFVRRLIALGSSAEWLETAKQHLAEGLPNEAETLLAQGIGSGTLRTRKHKACRQQALKEKAEREKARRLVQGLQQARELWTQQKYDECLKLLQNFGSEFPGEEEVARLFETVRDDQLEQHRRQGLLQSRNLLTSGRHDDAIALLSELQKQFPNDEEIPSSSGRRSQGPDESAAACVVWRRREACWRPVSMIRAFRY